MPKQGAEATTYTRYMGFDTVFYYDSSSRQEYVCLAFPGALTSSANWQIYKLSYDSSGRQSKRRYAEQNDKFDKIADNYSTYDFTDI